MANVVKLTTGADFQLLEAGKYRGTVTGIAEGMSQFDASKPPKPRLTWDWDLMDPETGDIIPHKSWTSTSLHPNSTLPPLLAALGIDASDGELDLDECIGRTAFLVITQALKQDNVTMGNKTVGYAPLKKGAPAAKRPTLAAPVEDDSELDSTPF